jgi:pimeloyl-ACP methyl ester carboxylesterase
LLFFVPLLACCQPLRPYAPIVTSRPVNFVTSSSGQRIHVERLGRHGSPVVLIHGFCSSTHSFRLLAPRLARHHRVFAIDLNGFGYTQRPHDPAAYDLEGQAALVRETLDRLGLGKVDLVGHSFGSVVALRVAEMQPRRVGRLVLISPASSVAPMPLVMRFPPARHLMYPFMRLYLSSPRAYQSLLKGAYHQPNMPRLADSEVYRNQLLVEGFHDAYHGFGHAMNSKIGGVLSAGDEVRQPVLILAGRHDQIVPLPMIRSATAHLRRAKLVVLDNCGHSAMEEAPARTAREIHRFLAR